MRQAGTTVAPAPTFDSFPVRAEQASSRTAAVIMLLLLIPVLGTVLVPIGLLLVFAPGEVQDAVGHHPLIGAVLGLGLLTILALFLVPSLRVIQRFCTHRRVTIVDERVTVADTGPFRSRHWSVPLAEFRGVAHLVRAILSGVRHELILVHSARERSLVLHTADAIAQSTIDQATALLRLQQIPANELYRITQRRSHARALPTLPEAQAA